MNTFWKRFFWGAPSHRLIAPYGTADRAGRSSHHDQTKTTRETFINVRKMAALDLVFHGPRLTLAEFTLAVVGCVTLAILSFSFFFRSGAHPPFAVMLAFFFSWVALNYVPLLLYTIRIVRRRSAELEVAFELEHRGVYARKYTIQSALLLLPLVVPALALYQELQKRSRSDQG